MVFVYLISHPYRMNYPYLRHQIRPHPRHQVCFWVPTSSCFPFSVGVEHWQTRCSPRGSNIMNWRLNHHLHHQRGVGGQSIIRTRNQLRKQNVKNGVDGGAGRALAWPGLTQMMTNDWPANELLHESQNVLTQTHNGSKELIVAPSLHELRDSRPVIYCELDCLLQTCVSVILVMMASMIFSPLVG